jgi:signal transduction histidine kinase
MAMEPRCSRDRYADLPARTGFLRSFLSIQVHHVICLAEENEHVLSNEANPSGARSARANDEELHARAAELTQLARHLIQVAEEEKAELARELHDTFGSNLTAINMDLNWIAKRLPAERPELRERLQRALRMLAETVEIEQDVIDRLHPSHLDTLGLAVAIRAQCKEMTARAGVTCEMEALEDFDALDALHSITLYRAAQEALANVEKHANASSVHVDLLREEQGIRLRIRDDGVGVDQSIVRMSSPGLVGMRERIEAVGGILQVIRLRPNGTLIDVFVPT